MQKKEKDENISSEGETRVLLEDIRSEVKKIAKGHSGLVERFDKQDVKFEAIDKRFDILENAVMENSKAIKRVENNLTANIKGLEEKVDKVLIDYEGRIKKLELIK